jgi:cytochrome c oxidase subunit 3
MIVLVAAEAMLFSGLIGTFLVFRLSATEWPPADLPRLPLGLTALNTLVLTASLVPMTRAIRLVRRGQADGPARALGWTLALGSTFLAVQGFEWVRLVGHGLTLQSGSYGSIFYVLIGCHAAHVLLAVLWLALTTVLARRGRFTAEKPGALEMCGIYWYFVCGLWLVLFPLVYLS